MKNRKAKPAAKPHGHEHAHEVRKQPMRNRFTSLLLQWASDRRPKAAKPRKEMTEEERKAWRTERNRRRRRRLKGTEMAKAFAKDLGKKPPAPNTCRRRRLAERYPERKQGRK